MTEKLGLRNKLYAMEPEAIYFRGYYDGVGYLKKMHFMTETQRVMAALANS